LLIINDAHEIQSVMANGVWHIKQGEQLVKGLFEL
jgi:hypothetical protein